MTDKPIAEMSFEEAMAELESLVGALEGSNTALEESIKLSQRGADLKKHCEMKLKEAEEKVAQITFGADGSPDGLKPFEE